jgi:hypothetical protein
VIEMPASKHRRKGKARPVTPASREPRTRAAVGHAPPQSGGFCEAEPTYNGVSLAAIHEVGHAVGWWITACEKGFDDPAVMIEQTAIYPESCRALS